MILSISTTALRSFASFLLASSMAAAAAPTFVQAKLQPASQRKAAASFSLQDAAGNTVKMEDFRGRVVLLDFWATWCGGCKQEIPWFVQFQKQLGRQGFSVVGVSVDEGGWKVLKPFLDANAVPYTMLLSDKATPGRYGIANLPDTFLIDRQGRVAAIYKGLVDRSDIEANIKTLIKE